MLIKRFGDRKTEPVTSWMETAEGKIIDISEEKADALWFVWVVHDLAYRDDNEQNTVFAFKEPVEI